MPITYQQLNISIYEADKRRLNAIVKERQKQAKEAGERLPKASEIVRELIHQEAARLGVAD